MLTKNQSLMFFVFFRAKQIARDPQRGASWGLFRIDRHRYGLMFQTLGTFPQKIEFVSLLKKSLQKVTLNPADLKAPPP